MRPLSFSLFAAILFSVNVAYASIELDFGQYSLSSNSPPTGASAKVELVFTTEGNNVRVTVNVTNTTGVVSFGSGATESMLTGLALDIPGLKPEGNIEFVENSFIGGQYLDTMMEQMSTAPFGTLDFAATDNNNYNGGNAKKALPENMSDTFSFALKGDSATNIELAFKNAFNDEYDGHNAVVRFQMVNAGEGSDKLLYKPPGGIGTNSNPPMVPEPSMYLTLTGLLVCFGLAGWWQKRRQSAVQN